MALKYWFRLSILATLAFYSGCKTEEDKINERIRFIGQVNAQLQKAALNISACAGNNQRNMIRFSFPTADETSLQQIKQFYSQARSKGFQRGEYYSLQSGEIKSLDQAEVQEAHPLQKADLFQASPYKGKQLALMQPFEMAGKTQPLEKKIQYALYGNYDSFGNILRYLRNQPADNRAIASKVYPHLVKYYKTGQKSIRLTLADMVNLMIQNNMAQPLVKNILGDSRVPAVIKKQVIAHIRVLKIKSYKKQIHETILSPDAELARESALACLELKDRGCRANYQKMLKRHCLLEYDHDEMWLTSGFKRL